MNLQFSIRTAATGLFVAGAAVSATAQDIVIGASLPFAGPFAQTAQTIRDGYELSVKEINANGGVDVGGKKRKLKLVILDNQGDVNQIATQGRRLVQSEKAVALLGAVTPMYNVPISVVADQFKIPALITYVPIEAWQTARKGGWKYAWNLYSHEPEAAAMTWVAADLIPTNKKAAMFLNTDDDGEIWSRVWPAQAKSAGYDIVYTAKVPMGTTNFSTYIAGAKAAGAEIVLGQLNPPDAIAFWKQMKALEFKPKMATCEKCASGEFWGQVLGPLAEGTMTSDVWARGMGGPGVETVLAALGEKWRGKQLTGAVLCYTLVQVLADALHRAGTTEPEALNAAIAKTDADFAVGRVKYTLGHGAPLPSVMLQWRNGTPVRIGASKEAALRSPSVKDAPLQAPIAGLN